ncbi:MAG: hypothetical protein DCC58_05900 [Chloroflexi bacterium]|nr:MAG: hypothetical protein DCC58_05900 [Chloroflexota bacterium]
MPYGPIELLVVKFPGNQFTGEIIPALKELVDSGTIRIIDILFISKSEEEIVTEAELGELLDEVYAAFDPLVDELAGLLTHDDAVEIAKLLPPNSSAGIMLFENAWAKHFADAIVAANGEVLLNERIPRAAIEELIAEQLEAMA